MKKLHRTWMTNDFFYLIFVHREIYELSTTRPTNVLRTNSDFEWDLCVDDKDTRQLERLFFELELLPFSLCSSSRLCKSDRSGPKSERKKQFTTRLALLKSVGLFRKARKRLDVECVRNETFVFRQVIQLETSSWLNTHSLLDEIFQLNRRNSLVAESCFQGRLEAMVIDIVVQTRRETRAVSESWK